MLSLLGLGAGWAMLDMFDGKDEAEEETPEPVEGEDFVLDGTDDATEGTAGNDTVAVTAPLAGFGAGAGDDLLRVTSPELPGYPAPDLGDDIGAVLTGGDGADTYLIEKGGRLLLDSGEYPGNGAINFEITDFNPEEDRLALSTDVLLGYTPNVDDATQTVDWDAFPLKDITIEQDPDGAFVDLVLTADRDAELGNELVRIRLWGLEDFDPSQLYIATEGPDGETTYTPIQISDGSELVVGDNTAVVGHDGADTIRLEDTEDSFVTTQDGDDTVTGSTHGTVYTGDGDDTVTLVADNALIDTGEGADSVSVTGSEATVRGGAGDDALSVTSTLPADGSHHGPGLYGEDGDDTLTHEEGSTNTATLHGGAGHDTLIGHSGDRFVEGEDVRVTIDAPLDPDTDHRTYVGMSLGGPGTDGATSVTLEFPEGTTGTLHLVATDESGNMAYFQRGGIVDVFFVPEGESFDPDNPDNATKVAILTFASVEEVTEYPFPDHGTYLNSSLSVGSVTVVVA